MLWWSSVRLVRARQILGSWRQLLSLILDEHNFFLLHCNRICWLQRESDTQTNHGSPVSDVIQDFVLDRVKGHTGLQNQPPVQADFAHHSQQQEQLLITVRPWTEGHTVGQVLQRGSRKQQATK